MLMPTGESVNNPNIWFYDQTGSKGSEIFVDNISFNNNMTSEVYADDLVTPRTILNTYRTRIQWITSTGLWYNLSYPLSPMDSGAFNRTQFYFYAKWTGTPTSVTLKFEITLLNNNSKFNRSVTITANGTYYILTGLEMCKACTRYMCTAVTSGFTGMRVMVNQSRWGVIAKYDKTYYVKDASFQFYGGYMPSDKTISINDNIVFNLSSTFDDYPFLMYGQNHIQFTDCCIYVNDNSNLWSKNKWLASLSRRTNITRCYFYIKNYNKLAGAFATDFNITSSVLNQVAVDFGTIKNINDTVFVNTGNSALKYYNKFYSGGTLKDCIFKDSKYGFYTYGTLHNYNVTDCLFKNIQYLMFPNSQTQIVHFNNCTSTSWTVDTSAVTPYLTGQTYRSYSLEARIMNGSSPISSASVKIYNKDNVLKYSGTTSSGGYIPKQMLDFCVWNTSYPGTPYLFAPYTINITKTGFRSLNYVFNITTKLNLSIGMTRNTTTPLTLYENIGNAIGTHQYSLTGTGYKVWANYTSSLLSRQNLNAYLTGTHQSRWNATTGTWMSWANYSGANLIARYNQLNPYQSGTLQTRYNATTNNWVSWANVSGATLLGRYNKLNAYQSGTNQNRYNSSTNIWMDWTNVTGANLISRQNIVNVSGTHQSGYNATTNNWMSWANYTTGIGKTDKIVNATGTTQYRWNSTTGKYWVWANWTGTTTPISVVDTKNNVTGSTTYTLDGTGYHVASTHESILNQISNLVNATGTHQKRWTGTVWDDWANITGTTTPITLYQNPVNASGTHTYMLTGTGYNVYANYTGYNGLSFIENLINATGTHQQSWSGTAWTIYNNYTGNASGACNSTNLTLYSSIINASGFHNSSYDPVAGWSVWANYTGNTTALHLDENIVEAIGSHDYLLNNTGYWVWANYTGWSSALFINTSNMTNVSGYFDYNYDTVSGWNVYANFSGNLTPLNLLENIINATGSHDYLQNSTGYWVWANYTGNASGVCNSTNLTLYENIVNASGFHNSSYDPATGWKVWANYSSGIGITNNIVNATGTHQYRWNSTSGKFWVWANYTGDTTPVTLHQNPINATGTHTKILRGIGGWDVYANYTGNASTAATITLYQNIVDASGTHQYAYNGTGYRVYANYTGYNHSINFIDNIVNATGSHDSAYNTGTGWKIWNNYTGNTTPVFLFDNFLNATGTHVKQLRLPGWYIWSNVTGNTSTAVNVTTIIPISTGNNIASMPFLLGLTIGTPGLFFIGRRRRKK